MAKKEKIIVLTGGGTAGHIMPNLALVDELKQHFDKIYYIGSNGMEKEIIEKTDIPFYQINATKFVRKISFKTFLIPFKLLKSISEAKKILKKLHPDVIFSKGGFVSVPVCIAGKKLKIKVVSHESDLSMGLANKIILHYANAMCTSFKETSLKNKKCIYTGSPIRKSIFNGNKQNVLNKANFNSQKSTVLFMGGSLGAKAINDVVFNNIDELTKRYNVLHITGKSDKNIKKQGYYKVNFTNDIQDFFACSDICVTRSGANTIFELASLKKPMLLIPLPKGNSRGDQVENAENFKKHNIANVLPQSNLNLTNLIYEIEKTLKDKEKLYKNMQNLHFESANERIIKVILNQL